MSRILVVDDEEEIVKIVVKFLEKNGFETISTYSGQSALEIINSNEQLIAMIIDMKMPKISGLDILLEMHKKNIKLPVIILSGSLGACENVDALKKLGYDENEILYKPIDLNDLLVKIRQILSGA